MSFRTRNDSHFDAISSSTSTVGATTLTVSAAGTKSHTYANDTVWAACAVATEPGMYVLSVEVGDATSSAIISIDQATGGAYTRVGTLPATVTYGGIIYTTTGTANSFTLTAGAASSATAYVSLRKVRTD